MARPLSSVEYSQLRSICPRAKQKLLKLRFQWRRTWQLILPQPTDDALRFIASLTDIWLSTNQLELALDYVFSDPVSTEILFDYFACHLLLKWHGNRRVRFIGNGVYWAKRTAPRQFTLYADRPSKVAGGVPCVHLEMRFHGAASIKRLDITSAIDLIDFDHRSFWQNRLTLYAFDIEILGRRRRQSLRGRHAAHKRIRTSSQGHTVNIDARAGRALSRLLYRPMSHQILAELFDAPILPIDRLGIGPKPGAPDFDIDHDLPHTSIPMVQDVKDCFKLTISRDLTPLDNGWLLPVNACIRAVGGSSGCK